MLKVWNVGVLVLLVGSECPVSKGCIVLLSISISDVGYRTNGDWLGYENGERLRARANVRLGWTLSRRTVYWFSV